ncbi:DUF4407 domain-containing protein [Nonomuraea longispora]|uniref:DUF4407 domain-containing protein n=1 Tax=Nonomuraea longispora TaxID=1848320 RepID=A0A4R4NDF8_9ACTN|nr:DUF4407 domain-containing protein [Nonomuraea longispora]TDC04712.1 DUF4407 domain-containing protein [Nonomuraea longispora]
MIGRWLIVLSGARPEVLDKCQGERARFHGMGGAILTTACVAAISMTFALASALKVFAPLAVLIGLVWGVAILSLDRWLVTSLPAQGGRRFWLALPRVALALLLGAVISTPLVLQIFKPEIDAEIVDIQQERTDAFTRAQQGGETGRRIAELDKSATALEAVIASRGESPLDPADDPRIKELTKSRAEAVKQRDKFYQEWQCQLYIGPPKCAKKGQGPLAKAAEEAYAGARDRARDLDRQIERRRQQLGDTQRDGKASRLAQAEQDLRGVQAELVKLTGQQAALRDNFSDEMSGSDGLMLRLEALSRVARDNATLSAARLLLFLFILLIECLPIIVKLMQRPGSYDTIVAALERKEVNAVIDEINEADRRLARGAAGRDGPTRPYTADEPPPDPYHDTGTPFPPPRHEHHETRSFEDEALRNLRDNRASRTAATGGRGEYAGLNDDW